MTDNTLSLEPTQGITLEQIQETVTQEMASLKAYFDARLNEFEDKFDQYMTAPEVKEEIAKAQRETDQKVSDQIAGFSHLMGRAMAGIESLVNVTNDIKAYMEKQDKRIEANADGLETNRKEIQSVREDTREDVARVSNRVETLDSDVKLVEIKAGLNRDFIISWEERFPNFTKHIETRMSEMDERGSYVYDYIKEEKARRDERLKIYNTLLFPLKNKWVTGLGGAGVVGVIGNALGIDREFLASLVQLLLGG